jgi:hypothetical protein
VSHYYKKKWRKPNNSIKINLGESAEGGKIVLIVVIIGTGCGNSNS